MPTPTQIYYNLRFFKMVDPDPEFGIDHEQVGDDYIYSNPPWVPRKGEFVRLHDYYPEVTGWVEEVVTVFYGHSISIEVYIKPRKDKT